MRVAVWYNLPSGGGKRALYYHVKGLHERGHEIRVWTTPSADLHYCPLSEFSKETVGPLQKREYKSRSPLRRPNSYAIPVDQLRSLDAHCDWCAAEMRKWKPDILFSSSCMIAGVAPIAQKVDFPSLIYLGEPKRNLHEARPSNPWALPANGRAHGLAHRLRNMVTDISTCQGQRYQVTAEIRNARAFGRILVNSCFSRESVSRAYGLDSMVCYLGVDSTLFRPSSNARKPFVVGLGAFHEAKGIDRAIRAVGRVRPELRPDLVWIGNTPYGSAMADFTKLAAACGVQLRPFVRLPDDDLVEYLGTAALMLYTSRLEPFGFAPLEANACGTPVVGIAEGGVRETIRHGFNGFLAGNDDPDEIAAHMETLLENPGLASRMGADGRRFVEEEWNWGKAIDRLERNLFDVCAKNIPAHV